MCGSFFVSGRNVWGVYFGQTWVRVLTGKMVSKTYVIASLCFLLCTLSTLCSGQNEFYINNGIVPELLPVAPTGILTALYKGGVSVNMCSQLDPRKLREPPTFGWEYQEGVSYTLLMLDMDVPSRQFPLGRSLVHFMVMNITGNNVYGSPAETVFDYMGPSPLLGSGLHRYVFVVYEQNAYTTAPRMEEKIPFFGRFRFSLDQFVKNHYLTGPIAGNCFLSEFSGF